MLFTIDPASFIWCKDSYGELLRIHLEVVVNNEIYVTCMDTDLKLNVPGIAHAKVVFILLSHSV